MAKAISFICPECGEGFERKHHRQQFCTPAHKAAYSNRQLARGYQVASLAQAWRLGRNTSDPAAKEAASLAFTELCRLLDAANAEDHTAGRPNALRVYRRRMAAGLLG